ncbi:MAG: hypothetical protein VKJ02_09655 [Snowella sp.]|nr:hypothetical protein [Snowella sp.]
MNLNRMTAFSKSVVIKSCLVGLGLVGAIALIPPIHQPAIAHSVCGLQPAYALFRTKSYLVTICLGEATFQLIMTYLDGTGYRKVPVEKEGQRFRGSDGKNNFIIDSRHFIIGTDGEPPIREAVIQSNF